jgi:hypothetical protein
MYLSDGIKNILIIYEAMYFSSVHNVYICVICVIDSKKALAIDNFFVCTGQYDESNVVSID